MKKAMTFMLVCIAIPTLSACNFVWASDDNNGFEGAQESKAAVEYWAGAFNLKYNDMVPDIRIKSVPESACYFGSDEGIQATFYTDHINDSIANAYVSQIYQATQNAADNKMCIAGYMQNPSKPDTEKTLDQVLNDSVYNYSWNYLREGKYVAVEVNNISEGGVTYLSVSITNGQQQADGAYYK